MSKPMTLITGGAGYIGSHVAQLLNDQGESLLVLDNLSTGFEQAVAPNQLIIGDVADTRLVASLLQQHNIDTVIHLAANTAVPQSIREPSLYYRNNTCATLNLLDCCIAAGIKYFILSSTAAVYGNPKTALVDEEHDCQPINPYGHSKLACEWILRDVAAANKLHYVILRYFNVAGADPQGRHGNRKDNSAMLIDAAVKAAMGLRNSIAIFGTDYSTPDGTAMRDYIHVSDLAVAHASALQYLRNGGESVILNCGYGRGYSVREILNVTQSLCKVNSFKIQHVQRRPGDAAAVIADARKIVDIFRWTPGHNDIVDIISTELRWQEARI